MYLSICSAESVIKYYYYYIIIVMMPRIAATIFFQKKMFMKIKLTEKDVPGA